jgi:hypothetical protein
MQKLISLFGKALNFLDKHDGDCAAMARGRLSSDFAPRRVPASIDYF